MRLAVITDEVSQEPEVAMDLCAGFGGSGIEMRSAWGFAADELPIDACEALSARVQQRGMEVVAYASPAFKCCAPRDRIDRLDVQRTLERCVARASALRAPLLRAFSFYREGPPNPTRAAQAMHAHLRHLDLPGDISILLETGTRTNTPDAWTALDVVEQLSELCGRRIDVLWDPGNTVFSGLGGNSPEIDLDMLGDRIRHVHVKDPHGQLRYVKLGHGSIDWPNVIRRLRNAQFQGYLSLETHWRAGADLTRELRDSPRGKAFSAGGEPASRACLAILRGWMEA